MGKKSANPGQEEGRKNYRPISRGFISWHRAERVEPLKQKTLCNPKEGGNWRGREQKSQQQREHMQEVVSTNRGGREKRQKRSGISTEGSASVLRMQEPHNTMRGFTNWEPGVYKLRPQSVWGTPYFSPRKEHGRAIAPS